MSDIVIAQPSIIINDEAFPVVVNSVSFNLGLPKTEIKTQFANGRSEPVHSVNFEEAFTVVKVEIYSTTKNIDATAILSVLTAKNVIRITDEISDAVYVLNNASLLTDIDAALQVGGTASIEFGGDPIKVN